MIDSRGVLRALKWDARHAAAKARSALALEPRWRNVVFVVGCGRSGTTLLGEMLALHPQVHYLNEPRDRWSAVDAATDDIALFGAARGKLRFEAADASDEHERRFRRVFGVTDPRAARTLVEKLPQNCFRIPWLRRLAPRARIVHIVRDWPGVVASIAKLSRDESYAIAGRPLLNRWWGTRYSKLDCFLDEMHGSPLLADDRALTPRPVSAADFERLAACEWYASILAVHEARALLVNDYLEIRYEDLVREPRAVLERLQDFIPLGRDEASTEQAARLVRRAVESASPAPAGVQGTIRERCDALAASLGYDAPHAAPPVAPSHPATPAMRRPRRVGILFERFGPYHHARARAAAAAMPVHAIEIFRRDSTYAWDPLPRHGDYPVRTLFDDPASMHAFRQRALWNALDEVSPEVIAIPGWGHWYSNAALSWAIRNDVRVVAMSETTRADHPRAAPRELGKKAILRGFDAALVGGTPQWRYLLELGFPADRIVRGYDAVDNDHFLRGAEEARSAPAATRDRYALPERYFLTSCRLIRRKNVATLVRAFAAYRQRAARDSCDLVVLGDGPERTALERLARETGVAESVHFMGFRQYPELPAFYALARAFILPSLTEPWGLVVNEAMACGIPVLASETAGCARDLVVPGETGWRFAPRDTQALAARLCRLAEEPALSQRMGDAARRFIADWGPERFASGLEQACEIALARPRAGLSLGARLVLQAAGMR
jgi:glycosyltransferase involved in cell wall biosynthesis